MLARGERRDGALFLLAGLIAGVGHYGFQALASRALDAQDFADFSGWLAHLTVAFVAGGVVQYFANFFPLGGRALSLGLIGANAAAIGAAAVATGAPAAFGPASVGAMIVLAAAFGWAAGQAQIRLDFFGLATAQILAAAAKLAGPLLLVEGARGYALGVAISYVPALWWLTTRLGRAAAPARKTARAAWGAPVVLAVAANVLPQFDLLVTRHAIATADFATFARASLFYKAIYFVVIIFAQWMLPRQIRGGASLRRALMWVGAFAGAATLGLTLIGPLVAEHVLKWESAPPPLLVLASCAHVSLLTLLFLVIQDGCARGRWRGPATWLGVLGGEAAVAIAAGPTALGYVGAAIAVQTLLLIAALRVTSPSPA